MPCAAFGFVGEGDGLFVDEGEGEGGDADDVDAVGLEAGLDVVEDAVVGFDGLEGPEFGTFIVLTQEVVQYIVHEILRKSEIPIHSITPNPQQLKINRFFPRHFHLRLSPALLLQSL